MKNLNNFILNLCPNFSFVRRVPQRDHTVAAQNGCTHQSTTPCFLCSASAYCVCCPQVIYFMFRINFHQLFTPICALYSVFGGNAVYCWLLYTGECHRKALRKARAHVCEEGDFICALCGTGLRVTAGNDGDGNHHTGRKQFLRSKAGRWSSTEWSCAWGGQQVYIKELTWNGVWMRWLFLFTIGELKTGRLLHQPYLTSVNWKWHHTLRYTNVLNIFC